MKKRVLILMLSFLTLMISVMISAETVNSDEVAFVDNRISFVPLKIVSQISGAELVWDNNTQTATIIKDKDTIKVSVDSLNAIVNKEIKKLESAPQVNKNTTYVPLRFIIETFGAKADFDKASNMISITVDNKKINLPVQTAPWQNSQSDKINKVVAERIQELVRDPEYNNVIKNDWFIEIKDNIIYKSNIFDNNKVEIADIKTDSWSPYLINKYFYYSSSGGISIDGGTYHDINTGKDRGIYRVDIESGERIKVISSLTASQMSQHNNKIYFIAEQYGSNSKKSYSLYVMNLDGSDLKCILANEIYMFIIIDNYIFYKNPNDHYLYRANVDGKNKIKFKDKVGLLTPDRIKKGFGTPNEEFRLQSAGEYVYYIKHIGDFERDLYRMKKDGSGRKKLLSKVSEFTISGNAIYAQKNGDSEHGGGVYKISLSDNKVKKLISCYLQSLSVIKGQLYYNSYFGKDDYRLELYRTDLNGNNKIKLISY